MRDRSYIIFKWSVHRVYANCPGWIDRWRNEEVRCKVVVNYKMSETVYGKVMK